MFQVYSSQNLECKPAVDAKDIDMPVTAPACLGAISTGLAAEPKAWKPLANCVISNKNIASQKFDIMPFNRKKKWINKWVFELTWQTATSIHDAKNRSCILRGQILGINDATIIVETIPKKAQNQES